MSNDETVVETIVRAEVLNQAVDQLLSVVDEATITIGKNGLSTAAVDPANVAMVKLDIDPGAFESIPSGSITFGTSLTKLEDYLDGATNDDPVLLAFDTKTRKMRIEHTNVEVDMAMIDPDAIRNEPDLPELDLPCTFAVEAGVFQDAVERSTLVSDHVFLRADVDDELLEVRGEGDTDTIRVDLDSEDLTDASFGENSESLFTNDYLVRNEDNIDGLLKPIPDDTVIECDLGTEFPIKSRYSYADDLADVVWLLSPRIQNA